MAKDGKSPKVERAASRPKKGAVRHHNPKPVDRMTDSGLLNDLSNNSWHQLRSANIADANLAKARQYLCDQLGERVMRIVRQENWHANVRPLVCQYIKSLALGDGTKPAELATICARRIEAIFVELSSKIIVGNDTIPAQRQEWYEPALLKYRNTRSQRKRPQRPSPQDIPRKRALQPTG